MRRELFEPKTTAHHGRVVKLIGDGTLMEFGSVVDAVNFAVDVQRAMALRNTDVPEDRRRPDLAARGPAPSHRRQKALDSLARYLQMFKNTLVVENVFRVVQEMDDDELDRRLAELERAYNDAKTLDPPTGKGPKSIH